MKRLLVIFALLVSTGCAARTKHAIVVTDTALYEILNNVHEIEQNMLCGAPSCAGIATRLSPGWTDAKSQDFNKKLLPAVEVGRQLNQVLAQWDPKAAPPDKIHDLVTSLTESLKVVVSDFPEGTMKSALLSGIARAQNVALYILDAVLLLKGQGL